MRNKKEYCMRKEGTLRVSIYRLCLMRTKRQVNAASSLRMSRVYKHHADTLRIIMWKLRARFARKRTLRKIALFHPFNTLSTKCNVTSHFSELQRNWVVVSFRIASNANHILRNGTRTIRCRWTFHLWIIHEILRTNIILSKNMCDQDFCNWHI